MDLLTMVVSFEARALMLPSASTVDRHALGRGTGAHGKAHCCHLFAHVGSEGFLLEEDGWLDVLGGVVAYSQGVVHIVGCIVADKTLVGCKICFLGQFV